MGAVARLGIGGFVKAEAGTIHLKIGLLHTGLRALDFSGTCGLYTDRTMKCYIRTLGLTRTGLLDAQVQPHQKVHRKLRWSPLVASKRDS